MTEIATLKVTININTTLMYIQKTPHWTSCFKHKQNVRLKWQMWTPYRQAQHHRWSRYLCFFAAKQTKKHLFRGIIISL